MSVELEWRVDGAGASYLSLVEGPTSEKLAEAILGRALKLVADSLSPRARNSLPTAPSWWADDPPTYWLMSEGARRWKWLWRTQVPGVMGSLGPHAATLVGPVVRTDERLTLSVETDTDPAAMTLTIREVRVDRE